ARAQDGENVLESKLRFLVSIISQSRIAPRENIVLGIEVKNVDATAGSFSAQVSEAGGRVIESHTSHQRDGSVTANLVFHFPLGSACGLVEKFKSAGTVRVEKSVHNPQVPESTLAIARIEVTLSNTELIVPSDEGLGTQIRRGLATSATALLWSLRVVTI